MKAMQDSLHNLYVGLERRLMIEHGWRRIIGHDRGMAGRLGLRGNKDVY